MLPVKRMNMIVYLPSSKAVGIMRCAAFSASKKRPLVELGNPLDAISHFEDKLLLLKSLMRTHEGKRLAQKRHQCMVDFLANIDLECGEIA